MWKGRTLRLNIVGRKASAFCPSTPPHNTFNVQRHLISAKTHRAFRATAMQTWREVTAAA